MTLGWLLCICPFLSEVSTRLRTERSNKTMIAVVMSKLKGRRMAFPNVIWRIDIAVPLLLCEHEQGIGLRTCSFKPRVLDLSIFSSVSQHPFVPGVVIGKPVWVSGFCPFFPCWYASLLGCSLLTYYKCQDFSGGPVLLGLITVSRI
jgi:hypothetical protein